MKQTPNPDKPIPPATLLTFDVEEYPDRYFGGHSIRVDILTNDGGNTIFFTQDETQALIEMLQRKLHIAQELDL